MEEILNEYKEQQIRLLDVYRNKLREKILLDLSRTYPRGCIIEDHIGRGEVIRHVVKFYENDIKYQVITLVHNLNKDGSISKREPERYIYFDNILTNEK